MTNNEAVEKVKAGYRMEKPERCPEQLYVLMLQMWEYVVSLLRGKAVTLLTFFTSEKPDMRPSFQQIYKEIELVTHEVVKAQWSNNSKPSPYTSVAAVHEYLRAASSNDLATSNNNMYNNDLHNNINISNMYHSNNSVYMS
jgi:hypothetical protein